MQKIALILLPLCIFALGCGSHRYVKKPWAEQSLEQASAACEMETAKTSAKGICDEACRRDLMYKCMKSKGWEWTYFPKES